MTTVMTHAFVGAALVFGSKDNIKKELLYPVAFYAGVMAMLPDLDVVAFSMGIPYDAPLGHRGLSHSLLFALAAAVITIFYIRLRCRINFAENRKSYIVCTLLLFLAVASHPLLDMLTDGGLGCALFAPFSWDRHFFPVTPIPVSPIGLHRQVLDVFLWEIALVWPVFAGLWIRSVSTNKALRLTALLSGSSGVVVAWWARTQYFSFL